MTKDQSLSQLDALFLTDPETGDDMVICSKLENHANGSQSFEVMSLATGTKVKITFRMEDV